MSFERCEVKSLQRRGWFALQTEQVDVLLNALVQRSAAPGIEFLAQKTDSLARFALRSQHHRVYFYRGSDCGGQVGVGVDVAHAQDAHGHGASLGSIGIRLSKMFLLQFATSQPGNCGRYLGATALFRLSGLDLFDCNRELAARHQRLNNLGKLPPGAHSEKESNRCKQASGTQQPHRLQLGVDPGKHLRVCKVDSGNIELAEHPSVPVDEITFRINVRAVILVDFEITRCQKRRMEPIEKLLVCISIPIHADSQNNHSFIGVLARKLAERGRFFHTGRAPACPEVQQQELSVEIRYGNGPAVISRDGELRSRVTRYNNVLMDGRVNYVHQSHRQGNNPGFQNPIDPKTTGSL